jgi:hypothetical protein
LYNNTGALAAAGGLAMTGIAGNLLWLFLTAFALLALGMAVLRTVPRREG